jgi:hypothetical protein
MAALYAIQDILSATFPVPVFGDDTLAHAQALAQSLATQWNRSMILIPLGTLGPYTAYAPGGSQITPASVNATF